MNIRLQISYFFICSFAALAANPPINSLSGETVSPNVIFFFIDDLAYNGISSFGGTHLKTPHIDSIASDGMKFTDAYAQPQCSPSRAAFLTGQSCARTHFTAVSKEFRDLRNAPVIQPSPLRKLPYDWYNIGKMFRDQGYNVGQAGKWHVDNMEKENKKSLGAEEYFRRYGFVELKALRPEIDPKKIFSVTQASLDFIEKSVQEKKPFFAYIAHHAVHSIYEARDELIQKYADKGYTTENPKESKFPAQLLAMTEELDNSIGMVLMKIKELGIEDNTLVVFMSDNGCRNKSWDHTPLRMGKGSIHEGGIRVPLIFKWPGIIKAGSASETPAHVVDLFPTFMEAVNGSKPDNHALDGKSLMPILTGRRSIIDKPVFVHHPHYVPNYHKTPASMMRLGDYKLIHFYGDRIDDNDANKLIVGESWQLYNVKKDPSEAEDLAETMPERLEQMKKQLTDWLNDVGAQTPTVNPNTDIDKWKLDYKKLNVAK